MFFNQMNGSVFLWKYLRSDCPLSPPKYLGFDIGQRAAVGERQMKLLGYMLSIKMVAVRNFPVTV